VILAAMPSLGAMILALIYVARKSDHLAGILIGFVFFGGGHGIFTANIHRKSNQAKNQECLTSS
jgi:hypothetical protein